MDGWEQQQYRLSSNQFGSDQRKGAHDRHSEIDKQTGRQTGRQADRQAGRQADRQTGRQADRQTGRQAGK